MIRGLLYALGFLTRIPVPTTVFADPRARAASLGWYPVVGLLLGLLLAALALALQGQDRMLVSALLLLAWVALTGGLHLDGLADSADAWIGGLGERERTLAIMKDPRCGPAAVVAVVLLLLTKLAALQALPPERQLLALLLAPVGGRCALVALVLSTPYARTQGMASGLADTRRGPWLMVGLVLLVSLVAGAGWGVWLALGVFVLWRRAGLRRVGGYTGDTAGALAEMTELAVLLGLALQGG